MIEETLNGGYNGLYHEVVTMDCYKIQSLDFTPSVVYDIGANIGVFTRYVHCLFPMAHVVAVEPDTDNCRVFKQYTNLFNVTLHEVAIGNGPMFENTNALNGSHKTFLSFSDQVSLQDIRLHGHMIPSDKKCVMLKDIMYFPLDNSMIKIDIEGNENIIWEDEESLQLVAQCRYIVAEIHPHVLSGIEREEAKNNLQRAIDFLSITHDVEYEHIYLFAKRKQ